MNSTINKTFCTCSTESLFLKYKQISKKAVKIGSFFPMFSACISRTGW